MSKIILWR